MKFTKMQGAGNDFIIINNIEEKISPERIPALVRRICARRLSIGADGVMLIESAKNGGDFSMAFYNSDGSLGEMCGNGARCVCRYGFIKGLSGKTQRVETTAGLVTGERIDQRQYRVRLNDPSVMKAGVSAEFDGGIYEGTYVELGNPGLPHFVTLVEELDFSLLEDLRPAGRALRKSPLFPKGANVTFAEIISPTELRAATYERGVEDFTLACGTGCGSAVAALALSGRVTGKNVSVAMPGGELFVSVNVKDGCVNEIYLTGPTNIVCAGEILDEDLDI